ncbi:ATP-binding cassette domain-containing protein [Vibrio hippocampi]|uniref:Type I secretion system ATP-binding protein PrsD n=1 Tax=Vibrio hippocampi TaxID=654686 RepID=A0ABM8ZJF2_9VIBR|nr:ATP-binding cassette domain-containing protein [Vibrio hippocampi]CAH0526160.1 Type I secretion system ATP-binding protein PrsD [Vibrio hippocampi]
MKAWNDFKSFSNKNYRYFLLFSIFANLLLLVLPLYSLQIFNRVLTSRSEETLLYLAVLAGALLLVQVIMDYARQQLLNNASSVYESEFSTQVGEQALQQAKAQKQLGAETLYNHQQAKFYLQSPFHRHLADLPWSVAFILVLFVLHPALGGYALVCALTIATLSGLMLIRSHEQQKKHQALTQTQGIGIRKMLLKGRVISALNIAPQLLQNWQRHNQHLTMSESETKQQNEQGMSLLKLIRTWVQVGVYAIGAWLVIEEQILAGSLLAASILLGRILAPIEQGAQHYTKWRDAKQGYHAIAAMLARPQQVEQIDLPLQQIELSLDNVSFFSSVTEKELLSGVTFRLKPGQCLEIKGAAGAGKSILLELVANYLSPTRGQVCINGIDVDKIQSQNLAENIGYLPQDIELFDASIADNISGFDRSQQRSERLILAGKLSGSHEFVARLPQNYMTLLKSDDVTLSRSELQRIGIARCFYHAPKLLILDQPTTALDKVASERLLSLIQQAKTEGSTIIFTSDYKPLQAIADYVVELKHGTVAKAYPNKAQEQVSNVKSINKPNYQTVKY